MITAASKLEAVKKAIASNASNSTLYETIKRHDELLKKLGMSKKNYYVDPDLNYKPPAAELAYVPSAINSPL